MAKSESHRRAEERLPSDLHDVLVQMAEEYQEAAKRHVKGGKAFVNYNILTDLILSGWRKSAQPSNLDTTQH